MVTAPGLTWSAAYNGDGARLRQTVNGSVTTYTLDLAAPLVTVLQARDASRHTQYVYGQGDSPLASYDPHPNPPPPAGEGVWMYLSGRDGLNSVRQETDGGGNVISARGFDPYGVPLSGNGGSPFGFTGEQTDVTGLVFLRARYMQPALGMFLSRDPWSGNDLRPRSMNGWNYVEGNPINWTDPSGYGGCLPLVGLTKVDLPEDAPFTVGDAIAWCRAWYSKDFWLNRVFDPRNGSQEWSLPQTISELYADYIFERGPDHVLFDGPHPFNQSLQKSVLVARARREFYEYGFVARTELNFDLFSFLASLMTDQVYEAWRRHDIAVSQFLGSFDYQVRPLTSGRVGFWIHNRTDLASGTHFADRFRKDGWYQSLEEEVEKYPPLAHQPLVKILKPSSGYKIISILKAKTRAQTIGTEGGGNMEQSFTWSERKLNCFEQMLPWPAYLPFLDIDVLNKYEWEGPGDFPPKV